MLKPIAWTGHSVRLLDQTRLPRETVYLEITDEKQMHDAIRRLVVRGAPAIGVAAAFGVYLGIKDAPEDDLSRFRARFDEVCEFPARARSTAVKLFWAMARVRRVTMKKWHATTRQLPRVVKNAVLEECKEMIEEDNRVCRAIGEHGLTLLQSNVRNPK